MLVHHSCTRQSYLCSGLTKLGSLEGVSSFMLPHDWIIVDFLRKCGYPGEQGSNEIWHESYSHHRADKNAKCGDFKI